MIDAMRRPTDGGEVEDDDEDGGLTVRHMLDGWTVEDASGGVWWPDAPAPTRRRPPCASSGSAPCGAPGTAEPAGSRHSPTRPREGAQETR
mgnify:CR=1 FL=1